MPRHVLIPVIDSKQEQSEEVEVEPLGENRYRVLCPPRFVHGLAVGDEIELAEHTPAGFHVVRRSGNLTVWFFAPEAGDEVQLAAAGREMLPGVAGTLEGTPAQMMVVTVPLASGWKPIEGVMNAIAARVPGASWYYANVYDPIDGCTPLGWWKKRSP